MRKFIVSFCVALCLFNTGNSQKDSIHTLFNGSPHIHIPLKYSYLQWDLGYTNFLFNNTSINGYSLDVIGLVFNNDLDIAVGFEGGGNRGGFGYSPVATVISYSSAYIKFVPMLFPEKLFNFSIPLKFAYSNIGVTDTNIYGGGSGRRGRGRGGSGSAFLSFIPGAGIFINIFHFLSMGGGINYRLAFSTPGSYPKSDYNNLSFSGSLRFKIYPHRKMVRQMEYYAPPQQRMN